MVNIGRVTSPPSLGVYSKRNLTYNENEVRKARLDRVFTEKERLCYPTYILQRGTHVMYAASLESMIMPHISTWLACNAHGVYAYYNMNYFAILIIF